MTYGVTIKIRNKRVFLLTALFEIRFCHQFLLQPRWKMSVAGLILSVFFLSKSVSIFQNIANSYRKEFFYIQFLAHKQNFSLIKTLWFFFSKMFYIFHKWRKMYCQWELLLVKQYKFNSKKIKWVTEQKIVSTRVHTN